MNHTQAPSPEARIREFLKQKNSPVEIQSSVGTRIPGDKVTTSEGLFYSKSKEGLTVPGFSAEYYANPNLVGTPSFTRTDFVINFDWEWSSPDYAFLPDEYFSVRWKSTFIPRSSGLHRLVLAGDDGVRLKIDGQIVVDKWTPLFLAPPFQESSLDLEFVANQTYQIEVEYVERDTLSAVHFDVIEPQDLKLLDQSERIAKESDIVVLFVGTSEKTESEGGDAMASMLFGESEPEGRLPISFPKRIEDSSAYASYPKTIDQDNGRLAYDDGIFVGYRHFDHYQIEPLFPFGFGLSYTKFDSLFGYLKITNDHHQDPQVNGTISSTNIGDRSGSEVLYVFVSKINSNVSRAKKELKFFKKFSLAPKETAQTDFSLKFRDFAYYDENEKAWVVEPGMYQIMLARSANEVLEVKAIELK